MDYFGEILPANVLTSTEKTEHNTTKANIHPEHKNTTTQNKYRLECQPMPNVMAVLPNIGGALCSTPQSLADAHYCSAVTLPTRETR